jgi:hypothetical protein
MSCHSLYKHSAPEHIRQELGLAKHGSLSLIFEIAINAPFRMYIQRIRLLFPLPIRGIKSKNCLGQALSPIPTFPLYVYTSPDANRDSRPFTKKRQCEKQYHHWPFYSFEIFRHISNRGIRLTKITPAERNLLYPSALDNLPFKNLHFS